MGGLMDYLPHDGVGSCDGVSLVLRRSEWTSGHRRSMDSRIRCPVSILILSMYGEGWAY